MVTRKHVDKASSRGGKPRVAIYTRVSTPEQAKREISVADQVKQLRAASHDREWEVVAEFTDAASAWKGKRPGYDEMLRQATSPARPFDIVFVHSLSRYSRKMLGSEQGFEILESVGVKVSSLTEMIEGDEGWLARSIIAMFSEQSSRETSKHVTRTRRENALQGFWNGGTPPLGLKAVAVDQDFGGKTKKRLAEDEQWSPTVRLIFKLHREGDGEGHPLGTVGIASYLNANKVPTRTGTLWHVSQVHRILTNEAYVGRVYMNRVNRRTGAERPREEWVFSPAPALVTEREFEETQVRLMERRPDHQAPRITTSDVLLGGLAHCQGCGGAMSAGSGTSKTGKVYTYYHCARRATRGASACPNPQRVPREKLDETVLNALSGQLLTGARVMELTNAVAKRRHEGAGDEAKELAAVKAALAALEKKQAKLVHALLDGKLSETATVRHMQMEMETEQDRLRTLVRLRTAKMKSELKPLDLEQAERLSSQLRQNLLLAPVEISRRYVRALVVRVDVGPGEVIIQGESQTLAGAAASAGADFTGVHSSEREWRTERDSNPR